MLPVQTDMTPPLASFAFRKVTSLIGPYGSGKTEIALALAQLAASWIAAPDAPPSPFSTVALGDIDVLKPYFRSREAGEALLSSGVELLAPSGALSGADLPILTPELRGAMSRSDVQLILDVGGDPVGARALGSLSDASAEGERDLWLVLNRYRPFMETVEEVLEQAQKMSAAANQPITGVVSNTHLMEMTTADDVRRGLDLSQEVAHRLDVDVRLVGAPEFLFQELLPSDLPGDAPLLIVRRKMLPKFLGGAALSPARR